MTSSDQPRPLALLDAVFLLFLTLKLLHRIDWSWWWVTAPLWGQLPLVFINVVMEDRKKRRAPP